MKYQPLPSKSDLDELIRYEPDTGDVYWIKAKNGHDLTKPCGGSDVYKYIQIDHKRYLLHRIIYVLMTGEQPGDLEIDHKDRNPHNNSWSNLRLCDHSENNRNKITSKGYYYNGNLYYARCKVRGQVHISEGYECPLLARLAYLDIRKRVHQGYCP